MTEDPAGPVPPQGSLLDLTGLSPRATEAYAAAMRACIEARRAHARGPDLRALLDAALAGELFRWPAFEAWRDYFRRVGWHPLAWDSWMLDDDPDVPASDHDASMRTLLCGTVGATLATLVRLEELRLEIAEGGITVGVNVLTSGHGVSPLCMGLEGRVFTDIDAMPRVPVYPGCGCMVSAALATAP